MIESSLCDFCSIRPESNIHLFWECPYAQPFWTQPNILNEKLNTPSGTLLTYRRISLCTGDISNKQKLNCINYIIILG